MSRLGRAGLLGALLLAASVSAAWAQAFQRNGFVCVIDLAENGLYDSLSAIGKASYPSGLVSTRTSQKVCTPSANPNVNITCTAQIAGWQGGVVDSLPVDCVINTAPCELGGPQPVPAAGGELSITALGAATLNCNWKN